MKKKRLTNKRMKSLLRRVVPFILVGVIASGSVIMSYEKAREVKAVAGVDDVALIVALMAMCGIAYTGTALGQDSSQEDRQKALTGFLEGWYGGTLKQGIKDGWIDPETGQYIGDAATGGGGDGDPDNNDDNDPDKNKFPTWEKLKERVAQNGGNVGRALGTTAGFYLAGAFASSILQSAEDGAKYPYGAIDDYKLLLQKMDESLEEYCTTNKIDLLEYPYWFTFINKSNSNGQIAICNVHGKSDLYVYYSDGWSNYGVNKPSEYIITEINVYKNTVNPYASTRKGTSTFASGPSLENHTIIPYGNIPVCLSKEESLAFWDNPYAVYPDEYVNPSTIGQTTTLKDLLEQTGGKLDTGLHETAILPTVEQLNQYFEDLKNAPDEEQKQEVMDEFVKSLTEPKTDPDPNPDPDPDPNPNPDPDPDKPGDNTGDDNTSENESFLADLKHLFPFCIPFDLVDCFRLFNAEPVTPRVEFPVHFGIVNYDHTFVFDLSDFNSVAGVCRSMFLILYIVGLILATRALIKG